MLREVMDHLRTETETALLPSGAFVHLDRGDALWVSDAPRRGEGSVPKALKDEFEIAEKGGLIYLTPRLDFVPARLRGIFLRLLKTHGAERETLIRRTLAECLRLKNEEEIAFMRKLFKEEIS